MNRTLFSALLLTTLAGSHLLAQSHPAAQPAYDSQNQLLRPEGYRDWKFVGSNLGMGYVEPSAKPSATARPQNFHNIYIQPEAYRTYVETGTFPEKTILVMEVFTAGSNASINKTGHFEDRFQGIEAAVKDSAHSPDKWSYYQLFTSDGRQLPSAKAFPKEACWSCHNAHAALDNVFVQFYPVLRAAREIPVR
jgi:hypothetical protein